MLIFNWRNYSSCRRLMCLNIQAQQSYIIELWASAYQLIQVSALWGRSSGLSCCKNCLLGKKFTCWKRVASGQSYRTSLCNFQASFYLRKKQFDRHGCLFLKIPQMMPILFTTQPDCVHWMPIAQAITVGLFMWCIRMQNANGMPITFVIKFSGSVY